MKINCYAVLADMLGKTIKIHPIEGMTVGQLLDTLKEEYPEAKFVLSKSRIAQNETFLRNEHVIDCEEDILLMPPSSGG